MFNFTRIALLLAFSGLPALCHGENPVVTLKKAVERSKLNQPGTKPFHLKAELAPSRVADQASNRTGEVEIWWASPTQWKREVRSPEFHQVAVMNAGHESQKNEGEYFLEWLREAAVALIDPVPDVDHVLEQIEGGEVHKAMGSTYYKWTAMSSDGNTKKGMGCTVAITDSTGLLFYGGCLGWGGEYKDYRSFHGRMVARTVNGGSPEVTAKVTTLEDLPDTTPEFFAPVDGSSDKAAGGAANLHTVVVEENALRKNSLNTSPVVWPPLQDGPFEGALTTSVVVDRQGAVREIGGIVSDNRGVDETARKAIAAMRFAPFMQDGKAVQVVSRITMPFKTGRPGGTENFGSAQNLL